MKMGTKFKQYLLGGAAAVAGLVSTPKDADAQSLTIFDTGLHAHTNTIGREVVHVQRSEARHIFGGKKAGAHFMISGGYEWQWRAGKFHYESPNAYSKGLYYYRLYHGIDVGAGISLQTNPNLPFSASITPQVNVPLYNFNENGMSAGIEARVVHNFRMKALDEALGNKDGLCHIGVKAYVGAGGNIDRPNGPIKGIGYANAGIFWGLSF